MTTEIALPAQTVPETLFDFQGIDLDPDGLTIQPEAPLPTYETWESLVRGICFVGNAWQWWLADAILWGEGLFGEESAQVADTKESRYDIAHRITGVDPAALKNYVSIASRIAKSRRRTPPLSFSTHEPVASLDPQEQTEWLQRAIDEGWTREALRAAIKEAKSPPSIDGVAEEIDDPAPRKSRLELVEEAALRVYHQAQPTQDGGSYVPAEAWAALKSALGED
jgi:hypothetical protein